ncbi:bifunctional heptose 7-phosphate kinase/heptose 1-phosphate adenyltransferase [Estrella lausannensis]|uniref:D-beta-D-heptose 7-phosphate kinase n=1 Tax=Estrella lausannensis TaxID=483423 RepID=A0A0H5DRQ7_9BACT|nr:bifunctional ADP-heptose synthase [Estrella lausannensis]CRX38399.1 D-beta-D-heptose 7-phosphate kinase [Estrella lausannensis]
MVKLIGPLSRLSPRTILVAGDFMLDSYTIGKVRRISPEAPVPVVHVTGQRKLPGGAGNVVLNLLALKASVKALGRVGADEAGRSIIELMKEQGVKAECLFEEPSFLTPVKNRIIADGQQITRVDYEEITPLSNGIEAKVAANLDSLFENVEMVALSDYGKGFLTGSLLRLLIDEAKKRGVTSIADPKGSDFSRYRGVDIIKPNLSEAYAAAGLPLGAPLELAAERILEITGARILLLTRSQDGISIFTNDGKRHDYPVAAREVKDVTGAGDTVLAVVAMALASGLEIHEAAALANVGASCAIEQFGCAQVSVGQLAKRLSLLDPLSKIFDEEHMFIIKEALSDKTPGFLSVSAREGLSTKVFHKIAEMAKKHCDGLVVGVSDHDGSDEFVHLIASLREVAFVVLDEKNLEVLKKELVPAV